MTASRTTPSVPSIVGLGESLLRLSPPGHRRLDRADALGIEVGGAEMNALIAASGLGLRATWASRLADNPLGHRIAAHARSYGLHTHLDWDPEARAPLYFVEHGVAPRSSEVLYDRSGTAMTALGPGTFDWKELVTGADAVLAGGITCALGDGPSSAVSLLLAAARGEGALTAFDVNHRSKMWTWERAVPVLREVLPQVDMLLAGRYDLLHLLPDPPRAAEDTTLARLAIERFGHEMVVLRETDHLPGARVATRVTIVTAGTVTSGPVHEADVVDAFGAGDAAFGTLLASRLAGDDPATMAGKAAFAGAFQHTNPGDACPIRPADLDGRTEPSRRILR